MGLSVRAAKTKKNDVSSGKTANSIRSAPSMNTDGNPAMDYILHIQRTFGNRAASQLLRSNFLQTKLNIGPANDKYEQEADRISERAVSMNETAVRGEAQIGNPLTGNPASQISRTPLVHSITPLQRKGQSEDEMQEKESPEEEMRGSFLYRFGGNAEEEKAQGKLIQRTCESCQKQYGEAKQIQMQRKESQVTPSIETSINSAKGSGRSLSTGERSYFEPRFGADFGSVNIHTGGQANSMAKSVNARAFTVGNDIFFGSGQYNTSTSEGKKLMAHELTHTVQQGKGRVQRPATKLGPHIQRKIVFRRLEPDRYEIGSIRFTWGHTEKLTNASNQWVENYVKRIGQNSAYYDIINAKDEVFNFVGTKASRRRLIVRIVRNLHSVPTKLYFDSLNEMENEVRKRAMLTLFMRASQGKSVGIKPAGYPGACDRDPGPRVSKASKGYWIVHKPPNDNYWFELSSAGKANGFTALQTMLYNHQKDPCLRTLMHCDYMVTAQHYFVMAKIMGKGQFNKAVASGDIRLKIEWNSYKNIIAGLSNSGKNKSLQALNLNSENEMIIGDHVIFFNHDAFDDLNKIYYKMRGKFSNWRLENAIITDKRSGHFYFQGHGYFSPKPRASFVAAMTGKMNELVATAQKAIDSKNPENLSFGDNFITRFNVLRQVGSKWHIFYHKGLGTNLFQRVTSMPLRNFTPNDYPNPFVPPGDSKIWVRRPIESRKETIEN